MKKLYVAGTLALVAAVAIAALWEPESVDQGLIRLQLMQKLPEYADALCDEPIEVQALFLDYADDPVLATKARLALLRHPKKARSILTLYRGPAPTGATPQP